MPSIIPLPTPRLALREEAGLSFLTDEATFDACGVRMAFSLRHGGVSSGGYASLNLGSHVEDDPNAVRENRKRLLSALGAGDIPAIVPKQVHKTDLLVVQDAAPEALEAARAQAQNGADAVVVGASRVAALLCFADCVSVVVVSPTGHFAVAHAGWRGALARISSKAVRALEALDGGQAQASCYNAYIGPCIRSECFECGSDVHDAFAREFGFACAPDSSHVDLPAAVASDLQAAGVDCARICDAGICTVCHADDWFSYRASGGVCGRHGAVAFSMR